MTLFLDISCIHISNIFKGPIKKTFWIVITLLALVGLGINAYSLIDKYLSYDVTVIVDVRHDKELTFPAVTGSCLIKIFTFRKS